MAERSVLHVLPHPGGGGETYVNLLEGMDGYRFTRLYVAASPRPSPELARGLARAARAARGHDLLHVHGEAAAGLCLPLLATRPSFVTLHGLHLARRLGGLTRRAALVNLRAVLRSADRTICVARTEHAELVRLVGAWAARKAVVVRNGVRIPEPDPAAHSEVRAELGIPENEPLAIWVGSLDERKDPLSAVRAAEEAGVTLLVVGDGPLRAQVEQAAQRSTRVLGRRDDVPRLLAAADLFIHTSRREGLALSLLEAMAHGLAAVVADLPENQEAIGNTGIAVLVGDEAAFAAAMRRLSANRDQRVALGEQARRRAAELFSAEAMVERMATLYDETS